ncbi:MAG: 3-isopropylmalate dehydrogenase [Clostridia bacterium]|nr:3-isopropylmalate dehydrogenase [Clostridia bacterium]
MYKAAVLPGDGIGIEIIPEAVKVLEAAGKKYGFSFEFTEGLVGGAALDATGVPLPDETLELCNNSEAILLGAVGGPKWDTLPVHLRPEAASLLRLRKELDLYANLRFVKLYPALIDSSPLKREVVEGIEIVIIREATGGLYFGEKKREKTEDGERAVDTLVYNTWEIERIGRLAFEMAEKHPSKHLTSVDKHNVLESSRLWRDVMTGLAKEYPHIEMESIYVDNCAMQLIRDPKQFSIMVTENMFGDILTDEASMLTGSIGMLASASIGGRVAMYEPAHGTAPDIAGQKKANPLAMILSAAHMLRYSFDHEDAAVSIEKAVEEVLDEGYRTPDLMSEGMTLANTVEMGDLVASKV